MFIRWLHFSILLGLTVHTFSAIQPLVFSSTKHAKTFQNNYLAGQSWRYGAKSVPFGAGTPIHAYILKKVGPYRCALGRHACKSQIIVRIGQSTQAQAIQACLAPTPVAHQLGYHIIKRTANQVWYTAEDAGMMHYLSLAGTAKLTDGHCRVIEVFGMSTGAPPPRGLMHILQHYVKNLA